MTTCTAKHTKYQPTEGEWVCPSCGAKGGDFCIEEGPAMDCELLHDEDWIVCYGKDGKGCGFQGISGKAFAARIQKAKNLVPCPHCKGAGLIAKARAPSKGKETT